VYITKRTRKVRPEEGEMSPCDRRTIAWPMTAKVPVEGATGVTCGAGMRQIEQFGKGKGSRIR
jgi:hypothetical protein